MDWCSDTEGITTWGRCKRKSALIVWTLTLRFLYHTSTLYDVSAYECRSSSQAMAGDEKRCFHLSKTCNVKGYQTNSLKQIQSWHGDSTELVPRTRLPAEHFNNGISEEHCQILVFPNTRQPPSLRPWSASSSHYSAGIDDFVSWASRLRLDG